MDGIKRGSQNKETVVSDAQKPPAPAPQAPKGYLLKDFGIPKRPEFDPNDIPTDHQELERQLGFLHPVMLGGKTDKELQDLQKRLEEGLGNLRDGWTTGIRAAFGGQTRRSLLESRLSDIKTEITDRIKTRSDLKDKAESALQRFSEDQSYANLKEAVKQLVNYRKVLRNHAAPLSNYEKLVQEFKQRVVQAQAQQDPAKLSKQDAQEAGLDVANEDDELLKALGYAYTGFHTLRPN